MTRPSRHQWLSLLLVIGCLNIAFHSFLRCESHCCVEEGSPCIVCHLEICPVTVFKMASIEVWVTSEPELVRVPTSPVSIKALARAPPPV